MTMILQAAIALALLLGWLVGPLPGQTTEAWAEISEGERLFALEVAPALESKCYACHGEQAAAIESNLVLTDRESMLRGGESGEAILVPGDALKSWLYLSATWEHTQLQMPPKENDRLDAATLKALAAWIDAGAPWPAEERLAAIRQKLSSGMTLVTSGGLDAKWDQRRYQADSLWAYRPLDLDQPLPTATQLPANNPVDLYLNQMLETEGITPASRADRRTLIRRLTFDLLGLPPTPDEVQAFVADPQPDEVAWSQLVDRLLASPYYGEQQARHWLDTIRYADSAGFANDYERPNAWRYRDYVVRCFNQDRPLDQFIREQLAGDEIDPHNPEMLIAVGMLRMGPWEQTGMSVDRVTRQQFLDDVTDVVGQAFLAHPLQCARCHDHKFDPLPTRDYYRIQAVFASTQFAERPAAFLKSENQGVFAEQEAFLRERIARYEQLLNELDAKEEAAARAWYAERGWEYAPRQKKLNAGAAESEIAPRKIGFEPRDFGLERIARKYLERHRWELDRYLPLAYSVYSGPTPERRSVNGRIDLPQNLQESGKLESTAILAGGDPFSPTLPVVPGVLSAPAGMRLVSGAVAAEKLPASELASPELNSPELTLQTHVAAETTLTEQPQGRRLEFATWLTHPDRNPLTPRVMVNRLWLQHFGQGIVNTPNNFGTAGSPPSHPALLDYLAGELIRSGWSTKHVQRLILNSQAYCRGQLATLPDASSPAAAYASFSARRLAAEEIRDSILAVSGLLNAEMGGAPTRPDMNAEVAMQPRQIMGTYAPVYQPSPRPQERHRRSLYTLRLRGLRDPMLEVFNQPSPDLPCEMRDSSTVAPQALTLFNSPLSYNRALAMAKRLLAEAESTTDRAAVIERAFALTYGRPPVQDELTACVAHWQKMQTRHQGLELADVRPPLEVTRQFVDENTGEEFSYTEPLEQNKAYVSEVSPATASPRARGLAEVCLVLLASNEMLYVP